MRRVLFGVIGILVLTCSAASGRQARVQICHFPPGNPANFQPLIVATSAVPAHVAHGDVVGDCPCRSDVDCPVGAFCEFPLCAGFGGCTQLQDPCLCVQIFDPVCGCDGQTYTNACVARCAHVSVAHVGVCAP